jgi:probable rRNA maturation factor
MSNKTGFNILEHSIDVMVRGKISGIAARTVKKRAQAALQQLVDEQCDLSVVLCTDKFIHSLNNDFRKKDRPTDVLSFPYGDDLESLHSESVRMLGDIIISVETAGRQAESRGHTLRHEVTVLLVHGILHLLGYTHENDDDETEMNSNADRVLAIIDK